MNNSQLGHIFSQGNGATAKGSNFHCDNNILYSYYTAIAAWHVSETGRKVCFISSNSMSSSTGKHISHIRSYKMTGESFYTSAFHYGSHYAPSARECILQSATDMQDAFKILCRSRKYQDQLIEGYNKRLEQIKSLAIDFAVTLPDMPVVTGDLKEQARLQAEKEKAARLQRAKEQEAKLQAEMEQAKNDFDAWIKTGAGKCPSVYCRNRYETGDFISLTGDTVVTSQGAECPLSHVQLAIRFYNSRLQSDGSYTPYQTNGHKIHLGHFTLDAIDASGNVKAGCHIFRATEIARFQLQWSSLLASEV